MNIKRSDLARYLILHTFGGFYLDLDMQLQTPLRDVRFSIHFYETMDVHSFAVLHVLVTGSQSFCIEALSVGVCFICGQRI